VCVCVVRDEPRGRGLERFGELAERGAERAEPRRVNGRDALHVGLLGLHELSVHDVLLVLAEQERRRVHVHHLVGLDRHVLEMLLGLPHHDAVKKRKRKKEKES